MINAYYPALELVIFQDRGDFEIVLEATEYCELEAVYIKAFRTRKDHCILDITSF